MESKTCENLIRENVPGRGSACECVLADDVRKYIDDHAEEFYELLVTLAQIPSPSYAFRAFRPAIAQGGTTL